MRMSVAHARQKPPPIAAPFTAAITGWCMSRIARMTSSSTFSARRAMLVRFRPSMLGTMPPPTRSAPEQNPWPAPVSTTTRHSLSTLISRSASRNGIITSNAIAFMRSGRLSVTSVTCGRGFSIWMNDMRGSLRKSPAPAAAADHTGRMDGQVVAVHRSGTYTFTKPTVERIELVAGLGVAGDVHAGTTVKHRSRVARDPSQPNLRQVHLIHTELHDELATRGFAITPGAMGENVTTRGIDLLGLARGTRVHLGPDAVVEITGLRNPCAQLDTLAPGLMAAVL